MLYEDPVEQIVIVIKKGKETTTLIIDNPSDHSIIYKIDAITGLVSHLDLSITNGHITIINWAIKKEL